MIIGSQVKLNLVPSGVMPVIYINQGDAGYDKEFLIYNGDSPYNVPSGVSATIRGTKADGFGVTEAATVTTGSNLVTVTITEQMVAAAGKNVYELVFVDTNDLRVASINMVWAVKPDALGDSVISDSDLDYATEVMNKLQSVAAYKIQLDRNTADISENADAIEAEAAARAAADTTLQNNINAEASTRATQDAVLSARMDTFSSLPSGSTAGNAELLDIRVAADGTTYPSAGDAVRGQVDDLKSLLDYQGDWFKTELSITDGYFIDSHGDITASDEYSYTDFIPVDKGETLYVLFDPVGNNYPWLKIATYDVTKTFISRVDTDYSSSTLITSPTYTKWTNQSDNIKYVKITFKTTSNVSAYVSPESVFTKKITDLNRLTGETSKFMTKWFGAYPEITSGYFIDNHGVITASDGYSYTDYMPIGRSDELFIQLIPSALISPWLKVVAYDADKKFLSRHDVYNNDSPTINVCESVWTNSNARVQFVRITYKSDNCTLNTYVSPLPYGIDISNIPTPQINELPKTVVAMPSVDFSEYVQQSENVSGAKGAIYRNGDYFCITYGENLDGTGTDIPLVSTSGCLAMKYKHFRLADGEVSDVSYGTFAQKGDSYIDFEGNTATMVGGAGLPSGVDDMQYFTTVYTVDDTQGMNYTFAGISNYGMTPCCCKVNVSTSGVTFGEIRELTLTVNGTPGKFDLHRVDPNYWMTSYYTTTPPFKDVGGWKWLQGVNQGIAYFTSDDGINWTYQYTIGTPFQPKCEVTSVYKNGYLYFACRTNPSFEKFTDALFVGKIDAANAYIKVIYRLPFVESRAYITLSGKDILLFYSPSDKGIMDCVRVCEYNDYELYFWKWFTIYKNSTWYIAALLDMGIEQLIPTNITNGYFLDTSGTPQESAEYCYIDDYFSVNQGSIVTIKMHSDIGIQFWVKVCLYDSNKNFISRFDVPIMSGISKDTAGTITITNANCKYIRITYKNMGGSLTYNVKLEANTKDSGINVIKTIYTVGGNGAAGSTLGMTFMQLSFDTSKPFAPYDIPAMVI